MLKIQNNVKVNNINSTVINCSVSAFIYKDWQSEGSCNNYIQGQSSKISKEECKTI